MTHEERATEMSVKEVAALLASHDDLARQLDWFKRQLFGSRSERRVPDPSTQIYLGEAVAVSPSSMEAPGVEVAAHRRRQRTGAEGSENPIRFDPSVPVQTIEIPNSDVPAGELDSYTVVGEKVTERLAQRPGAYVVLRYVRKVLKRKGSSDGAFSCPPAPPAVLEKSTADVSFLAGLLIDKLTYHLPLYRQHQRLAAAGVHIGRSTLTSYFQRTAELLEPIHEAQLASILESKVLSMDETPIRAGRKKTDPPGRGRMKKGYFWPIYGDRDEVAFPFAPTRSHAVVDEILKGFEGTLLTDGYEAYERFSEKTAGVTLAHCWAHARRGFVEAENVEPGLVGDALARIRSLYEHEERIREQNLPPEGIQAYRTAHCAPIIEDFFAALVAALDERALLPSNPFTKAARYALDRERALRVFLEHPGVPMDTNHLERTLRPIAVGRKNWLFCTTEVGARYLGVVQSLLITCTLHGIDPYTYLVDVLQRVQLHPASRVRDLIPRLWAENFADFPLRSDLIFVPRGPDSGN